MDWPQWWRNVEKVEELEAGDTMGIGRRLRFTWKSHLVYRLTKERGNIPVWTGIGAIIFGGIKR